MQFHPHRRDPASAARQAGFTIIEILFVVMLLAVLGSLAAPSFRDFVAAQRIRAASVDLSSALMLARAEAVKRNTSVVLAPQGGSWANGWTVVAQVTPTPVTVAAHEAFGDLAITGPTTNVTYSANSRVVAPTRFVISSTLVPAVAARCVRVDLSGMSAAASGTGCP
jgi:type IV fimbrial biogenesis protein FimT